MKVLYLPKKIEDCAFHERGGGRRKIECCMWRRMGIEKVDHIKHLDYARK